MQAYETFSVPRSLRPPIVMAWLCGLASVSLAGAEQFADTGVILVISESHAPLFRAIYARHLGSRRGVFIPAWQGDETRRDYVAYLRNQYDALFTIACDDVEARATARDALRLARAAGALIYPIGVSAAPSFALPGERRTLLALPGTRIAVVVESPFKTAEQPEQIPPSWHRAIMSLVERANAQAQDALR